MSKKNKLKAELILEVAQLQERVKELETADTEQKQALDYLFCRGQYGDRDSSESPKVIFLDLKLPKVNGLEVLKQVKSNKGTRKIPVIIVTSSAEDPDISTAYDLGANSYVVKPVGFDDFTKTINELGSYWLAINEKPI